MKHQNVQTIERRLIQAYHDKGSFNISNRWRSETMRRIRRLGPLSEEPTFFNLFEQFVWQMTPVACFLIIVMGSLIAHFGLIPEPQMVELILNESQENLGILHLLG